jgi:hypothetical protein
MSLCFHGPQFNWTFLLANVQQPIRCRFLKAFSASRESSCRPVAGHCFNEAVRASCHRGGQQFDGQHCGHASRVQRPLLGFPGCD